ncbi:hypothetical protein NA23_09570 [Fervidobacterium islandicum]|uniref:Uncharacterized protein n=1 Tax=Fervidobacterium islandicum TaxID=2423 RepID=A0AAI8CMZ9_FERIS|nr:hypothetical protein [Fervidobacterium islandicum]AMW33456.1 hypothetical protein NA23_09570 [Fervidobacterium islandicum]
MRKFYMVFTIVVIALILFSCGLKLPSKSPEKVKVQYTKYLEFPLTTLDFKVKDLVDSFANELGRDLTLEKTDPVTLKYATEITYSPGTLLQDVQKQLQSKLGELGNRFSYKIDTNYFIQSLSGQIELPSISSIEQQVNLSEVEIGDLELISNLSVPVTNGVNTFDVPSAVLSQLIFSEANLKSVNVRFDISPVVVSNSALIIDGFAYPLQANGTKNLANVLIKKTSSVKIRFESTSSGIATISLSFKNQVVDYFKDLDTSKLSSQKISISIAQNIPITTGTWKMALGGTVDVKLTISGFSGNISQSYNAKSGSVNIGSGSSNSTTARINLNDTELFTVGDGISITGTVELTGLVSADLRTNPKIEIKPNVQVKKIENYPITVTLPLPNNLTELKFTSDSGYMLLTFTGLSEVRALGTFGANELQDTSAGIKIPFKNISLPSTIDALISGNVNSNTVFYTVNLPEDQTIKIQTAKISGINISPIAFSQQVPTEVLDFISEATATIKAKINYNVTGTSGISLNISSNIFEEGNDTHTLSGAGSIELRAVNKLFDFASFTSFNMTIQPTVPDPVVVENVNIRDGVNLWVEPSIEVFEISKVKLKGQTYTQNIGRLINFGDIFKDAFAFIKDLILDINAPIYFDITNSTIPATLTLNISGTSVEIGKGEERNIGDTITSLIKQGAPLELGITIKTAPGELSKDSEINVRFQFSFPISAKTPDSQDVILNSGTIDLSALEPLKDIIENVSVKYKTYNNTTGLKAQLKLGPNGEVNVTLTDTVTSVTVDKAKIISIAKSNTPYQILLPKDKNIALNYTGKLSVAPYIAVDLKVATEVKLGN